MDITIKHMDVSVGTGQIIYSRTKVSDNDTFYRVELSRNMSDRVAQVSYLVKLSPIDRSTWARLFGHEIEPALAGTG